MEWLPTHRSAPTGSGYADVGSSNGGTLVSGPGGRVDVEVMALSRIGPITPRRIDSRQWI
jgi:hypothetical protein